MKRGSVATVSRYLKTGLNRSTWPTCRTQFFCCASWTSSAACAALSVIGFSTSTCLPCWSSVLASSKCVVVGVTMFTASLAAAASASGAERADAVFLGESLRGLGNRVVNPGKLDLPRRGQLGVNPHVLLAERAGAEDGHLDLVRGPWCVVRIHLP